MTAVSKDRHLVYTCHLPIRWGDMDAYGHVNNAMYFRYMEEARVQMVADWGAADIAAQHEGPVVITAGCTFLKSVVYPNNMRIDCYVGEPGRSSIMSYYELYASSDPEHMVCEGYAKIVWVDHREARSIAIPEKILETIVKRKV
ncbi:MAG: thioesterase [Proteobacteria bacterium]|nr:MAG: thioesterase [Pseudomonadota bacterium]